MSIAKEPEQVLKMRGGSVLGKRTILKSDHFPGCQNKRLTPQIDGAPNYRQVCSFYSSDSLQSLFLEISSSKFLEFFCISLILLLLLSSAFFLFYGGFRVYVYSIFFSSLLPRFLVNARICYEINCLPKVWLKHVRIELGLWNWSCRFMIFFSFLSFEEEGHM